MSSLLGFGCGAVMGRVGRKQSLRAIAEAFDAGITHFDLARSYGYGEAEALVGEALRGKRDKVVIATKAGLSVSRAASRLRRLKPIAQRLVAAVPRLRGAVRSAVQQSTQAADRFSVASVRASLEASLAALKMDYVDILLLHDCGKDDLSEELQAFLASQVDGGRVRRYGVATAIEHVSALSPRHRGALLYQFANGILDGGIEQLPACEHGYITHSPFSKAGALLELVNTQPELLRPLGRDMLSSRDVHRLMLSYALAANSGGSVICSMLAGEHLAENLRAVEQPGFAAPDVIAFAASMRRATSAR